MTIRESTPRRRVTRVRTLYPVPALAEPQPEAEVETPTESETPVEPGTPAGSATLPDAGTRPEPRPSAPRRARPRQPRTPAPARAGRKVGAIGAPRVPRRVGIILLVALAVATGGLVDAGQRWVGAQRLDAAHEAALEAARQTTVDFVTISAETVDRDLQRIAAGATGDFKDEFTRDLPQVRSAVVENQVHSAGNLLRAALVSGDLDSAVVLVAIDASVRNTGAPDGRISHYRIQVDVTLDPDADRWLISRLQFVG